ncbi:hypothetical protein D3C76_1645850 [compost metagenome]
MKDIKGEQLLRKFKYVWPVPEPQQPDICRGCIWGAWTGGKQFCSKQHCVKEERGT